MDVWFIRHWPHPSGWSQKNNRHIQNALFTQRRIAIHYQNKGWNPNNYKMNFRPRIQKFNDLREEGGIVCVDYPAINTIVIARVKANQKRQVQMAHAGRHAAELKYLHVDRIRKISGTGRTFLRMLANQGTLKRWPSMKEVVVQIWKSGRLPHRWDSLTAGQEEVVCQEYLRARFGMRFLLWPIGRTMPDVDIVGMTKMKTVYAQVTHKCGDDVERKTNILAQYTKQGTCYFFCPKPAAHKTELIFK